MTENNKTNPKHEAALHLANTILRLRMIFILSVLISMGIFFILGFIGNFLTVEMELEHADAIVVLSGNDSSRLKTAAELYSAGYSENIILTNTGNNFGEYNIPYTYHQVDLLKEYGVPEGALHFAEFVAKNTGQEATGIIEEMFVLHAKSAIIVTDTWHTRRVKIIFSDSFGNTGIDLQYYGSSKDEYHPFFWWTSTKGWKDVIGEYIRIIGYFIKRETNIPDYPNFDIL
jgi:uncharacterized SAM-binding protein YcdF (DUF218 family)